MRARGVAAVLAAAWLAAAGAAPAQEMDHAAHGQAAGEAASQRMMEAMDAMNAAMAQTPMTGRPGLDFAQMMIPHHQSAIDMAQAYLDSGENDPVLARISRDVIASQQAEIAELRAWIEANRDR
ncbi:DUF305 domain-containing protein [Aureimonas flava]|nr:DUF305 domain-containing protein [Aureimonas flava]